MSTHEKIEEKHKESMEAVANGLDIIFNQGKQGAERDTGFVLLVFGLGNKPDDKMNYISNANREDMICALKELVSRFEGRHIEETQTPTPGEQ